jgi:DNA-binding CsgD family transcriptional regulator
VGRRVDSKYGPLLREVLAGERLSSRERETLIWAARGKTADETGTEMFLAGETVKGYRKRVNAKLSADSTTHALAIAIRDGIVSIEEIFGDGP